jgi:hypothetical protein
VGGTGGVDGTGLSVGFAVTGADPVWVVHPAITSAITARARRIILHWFIPWFSAPGYLNELLFRLSLPEIIPRGNYSREIFSGTTFRVRVSRMQ